MLCLLDSPQRAEAVAAARSLMERPQGAQTRYPCYTRYYQTVAAQTSGDAVWAGIWDSIRTYLLETQKDDGGWPVGATGEEPGRIYATSMAVLTLGTPLRLVPACRD
jgi:hypothetical protein